MPLLKNFLTFQVSGVVTLCPHPGRMPVHTCSLLSPVVFLPVVRAYTPRALISTQSQLS